MNDWLGKKLAISRINNALPHISGKLLDVGCGNNLFKEYYGESMVGVDVFQWGTVDIVVQKTSELPFNNEEFDTVTIIAALNHIPNRQDVLQEIYRVLKNDGRLIITMIPPVISTIWHFLRKPWDEDQKSRGMKEGEVYGMSTRTLADLFEKTRFAILTHQRFMLGVNHLFVLKKDLEKFEILNQE